MEDICTTERHTRAPSSKIGWKKAETLLRRKDPHGRLPQYDHGSRLLALRKRSSIGAQADVLRSRRNPRLKPNSTCLSLSAAGAHTLRDPTFFLSGCTVSRVFEEKISYEFHVNRRWTQQRIDQRGRNIRSLNSAAMQVGAFPLQSAYFLRLASLRAFVAFRSVK